DSVFNVRCISLLYCYIACSFCTVTSTTDLSTLSLHDALPICSRWRGRRRSRRRRHATAAPARDSSPRSPSNPRAPGGSRRSPPRSEEHTSELQSLRHLVCRLLLEKKKTHKTITIYTLKHSFIY